MFQLGKVHTGDCVELMRQLPDNYIDLTVTSPPYDNLRKYNGYSFNFEDTATQLYLITKPGGVVVWVVGDATVNGSETGTSFKQALYFKERGFNLHDTMIYERSPAYPSGNHSTRYSQSFEYMFVFSKGEVKTSNILMDRQNRWAGLSSFGVQSERLQNGNLKQRKKIAVKEYGARYNIWNYATGKGFSSKDLEAHGHPAIFPEGLARDHVLTWTNPNDIVFDPFSGSGTTGKMAMLNDRKFLGFEISEEYTKLANTRIKNTVFDGL